MYGVIWCQGTLYICAHPTSNHHHQEAVGRRSVTSAENIHVSKQHHLLVGILPEEYLLLLPRATLSTTRGCLNSTVFRKATHTDLYLQWDSHHTLPSKYSVVGTLLHRANTICSEPQLLRQEEDHLYKALSTCNYPTWALNRIKMKIKNSNTNRNNTKQKKPGTDNIQKPHITVPYQRGLSESFKRTCNNHGVQVHFKGGKTIKNLLMAPKDQDPIKNRSGVIYRFKCNRVECDDEYIGESSRTFGERFKEHLKAPSPVFDHYNSTGHQVSLENFSIVGREEQNLMRAIKEALYIRVNNPSLNRNIGKYNLPHIWDEVLFNTPELKLK